MPRIPYYEVENATGKHAEFLAKLGTAPEHLPHAGQLGIRR